jgi:hypothetical protein
MKINDSQMKCPVCGNNEYRIRKRRNGLSMGVCTNCTLAYSHPLKKGSFDDVGHSNSSITNSDYYIKIQLQYEIQSELAIKKVPLLLNYWTSLLGKAPSSILEIGCGTGQYYEAWKK